MEIEIIDFHAEWCGPCKKQDDVFDDLVEDEKVTEFFDKVEIKEFSEFKEEEEMEDKEKILKIKKLDVDEEQEVAQEYKVKSIPTLVFTSRHEDEESQKRKIGLTSKDEIIETISSLVGEEL